MKLAILLLSVLFVVLSTLFLHAVTAPNTPVYFPTGSVAFIVEPVPNGIIRIERLQFPLALNEMIVFIQNTGKTILEPDVVIQMKSTVSHCSITADEIIGRIRPGEKRYVEISLNGCLMHHEHEDRADLTVTLVQGRKALASDTRTVHLRE